MIVETLVFGACSSAAEALIIRECPPWMRLRLLGNPKMLHLCIATGTMALHFGTIIGTMSATVAGLCSVPVVEALRAHYGYIEDGQYVEGRVAFTPEQLAIPARLASKLPKWLR